MRFPPTLALLPVAGLILATGPAPKPTDDTLPQPLVAAMEPGFAHDPAARLILKPYADATGTPQSTPPFDGTLAGLTSLSGPQKPDLALVSGPVLAEGCAKQVFAKLDWSILPRGQYQTFAAADCGAGAYLSAILLAWDEAKLHATPGWADFWDVAKYPGRRALPKTARLTLEIALMADGVAPADVYRTLRSNDGVERAFRKLDQLKPYVEWWDQPAEPGQYLTAGKALLTAAPVALLPARGKLHPGLQWSGCLIETESWAILHDTPHARDALIALAIAGDPARQADFAKTTGFAPATRAGYVLLPLAARAQDAAAPERLQGCLPVDEGFWLENGGKLASRFTAWVNK
jgi:putative spermidine/putrescine transport system substrate-binding protein